MHLETMGRPGIRRLLLLSIGLAQGAPISALAGDFAGFEEPVIYSLPSPAISICAGDLDGDGDVDLAMAHLTGVNGNSVSIQFNRGDGTFEAGPNIPVAHGVGDVAIADFNGDGVADLIAVSQGSPINQTPGDVIGRMHILFGLGGGEFAELRSYFAGVQPVGVAVGDLNGDGHIDIAVTNQLSGNVAVFLNDGHGEPRKPDFYSAGSIPVRIAIADLDLDGDLDIVVVNNSSFDVSVFMNDGEGQFLTLPRIPTTAGGNRSLSIEDINGDLYPEVVIPTGLAQAAAIHVNDKGQLGPPMNQLVGFSVATAIFASFDTDGVIDIAVSGHQIVNDNGFVGVLKGNGAGGFEPPAQLYPVGQETPRAQCVADFDHDGDLDIASTARHLSILFNRTIGRSLVDLTGDGFVNSADLVVLLSNWGRPGAADFDKSGAVDGRDLAHLLANWTPPGHGAPDAMNEQR